MNWFFCCFLAFLVFSNGRIIACGLNFDLPSFHFPCVNDQGEFSYWENLGEIDVGGGMILPINFNFNASKRATLPTLNAQGFRIGLTDANAVQLDEKTFRIYTPAGRYRDFRRDRKNPNILHGGKSWKGEIRGNTISVVSNCGDRLVYHQGFISQMHLKRRRFDFIRSGGKVDEIREGSDALLKIVADRSNDTVFLVDKLGQRFEFYFGERPVIAKIDGRNLIVKETRCVKRIIAPNLNQVFSFEVDERLQPFLKLGDNVFTWQSSNGRLISDGLWSYNEVAEKKLSYPFIERINAQGKKEHWIYDKSNGMESIKLSRGLERRTERFTKGNLKGKIRRVRLLSNGILDSETRISYNESGDPLRVSVYDKNGKVSTFYNPAHKLNNRSIKEFSIRQSGVLTETVVTLSSGSKFTFEEIEK